METLYGRVHAAATDVCRTETERYYRSTRMRAPSGWRERCVQDAVDTAVREVANPALAALHTQAPRVALSSSPGFRAAVYADARPKTRAAEVGLPQRHGLDGLRS